MTTTLTKAGLATDGRRSVPLRETAAPYPRNLRSIIDHNGCLLTAGNNDSEATYGGWFFQDVGGAKVQISRASRTRNILESISIQRSMLLRCSTLLETSYAIRRSSYKHWTEHEQYEHELSLRNSRVFEKRCLLPYLS